LAALLGAPADADPLSRRRYSASVTRKIRLLRAHGLIRKLGKSHRYVLTAKGHDIIPAVLAAQRVSLHQLRKVAA
jgi:DNA-binding HxlR family transcriptional regulator